MDNKQASSDRHDDPSPTREGGQGDEPSRSEIKLVGRALKSRWTLPENLPSHLVVRLGRLATEKGVATRDALAAIKLLVEIERVNLTAIDTEIKARTYEEMQEQIGELKDLIGQAGKAEERKDRW